MAIVRELTPINLNHKSTHTEAECTYSIVPGPHNEKFLQVDTYGSATRRMFGKKSQSIRFSPQAIVQLREILTKEL